MTIFGIAHRLLCEYEASGKYVNLSLNSHITDGQTKEDRAALTALLYGTVERKIKYDYFISALSGRSIEKISPAVRDILRIGLCALLDMDKIPDHAAVNECVKLARNQGERGFVNGVLRRAARERDSLPLPDKSKNAARYYSVYYSLPISTVRYFIGELGEVGAVSFFESTFERSKKTALTVNTNKISVNDFISKLLSAGYKAELSNISDISVIVEGSLNPKDLDGFSEGEFFVQDEASALAAAALGISEGDVAVDTCAAPGGKSFSLAVRSGDMAKIYSYDFHESKISLISDGAKRLGLNSVFAECRNALEPNPALLGKANLVLCDVPCSGLGVIGKKPDLRYKDIASLAHLPALQLEILKKSAEYLEVGGALVYSTCTLIKEENEGVVSAFLAQNPNFVREEFSVGCIKSKDGSVTLYPHINGTDGFFVAKIRKKQ